MTTRELSSSPALLPMYGRAAASALPVVGSLPLLNRPGEGLPDTELVLRDVGIDRGHLLAYSDVCGFGTRRTVPLTYPHVLAFPLHLALLSDPTFPFPVLGMVHVENRITQHRPLAVDERFDLRVRAGGLREHPRGEQFDVVSELSVDGDVVWRDVSTNLRRGRRHEDASRSQLSRLEPPRGATAWPLGADLGRRYAAASGDRNPIHLYALTARPFGFRRQIAHGMWSKARCVAALEPRLPHGCEVAVAFKKPVVLPTTVSFGAVEEDAGWRFGMTSADGGRVHVVGTASAL